MAARPRAGRQPNPIPDPDSPVGRFAGYLRRLQELAGNPSYEALAHETAHAAQAYSDTSLRNAAAGRRLPTVPAAEAFVRACVAYARANPEQAAASSRRWVPQDVVKEMLHHYQRAAHDAALTATQSDDPESQQPASAPTEKAPAGEQVGADAGPAPTGVPEGIATPTVDYATARPHGRRRFAFYAVGVLLAGVLALTAALGWPSFGSSGAQPQEPPVSSQGTVLGGLPQCRGEGPKGAVTINPCISSTTEGLHYLVRVKALEPTSEFTAHVWLTDVTTGRRLTQTLQRCEATLNTVGQLFECGPAAFVPEPGHRYAAAADITMRRVSEPPLWADPRNTGLMTAAVQWPPPPGR